MVHVLGERGGGVRASPHLHLFGRCLLYLKAVAQQVSTIHATDKAHKKNFTTSSLRTRHTKNLRYRKDFFHAQAQEGGNEER